MEKKIFVGLTALGLLALMVTSLLHLGNREPLNGSWTEYEKPEFCAEAWMDGSYQTDLENYTAANYSMHNFNTRIYNQIRYSAFHTANSVIIGKEGYIYERAYIVESLGTESHIILSDEEIAELAEKIYEIQKEAVRQGKAFIFIITPSKSDFESEYIPDTWLAQTSYYDSKNDRNYIRLKEKFNELGVLYVDANDILAQSDIYPVFYKSGIHWNRISAISVVNTISDVLEKEYDISVKRLECPNVEVSLTTNDPQDQDMYKLLNVFWTPNDEVYYMANEQSTYQVDYDLPNLFIQGGSFTNKILDISRDNRLFAEVQGEFYAKSLQDYNRTIGTITENLDCDELNHAINNADVIMLETNVENVMDLMPDMYDQILAHLKEGDRGIIEQPISVGIYGDEEDTSKFNWAANDVLYEIKFNADQNRYIMDIEIPKTELEQKYGTLDKKIKVYANGKIVSSVSYDQSECQISLDRDQLGLQNEQDDIIIEIVAPYFFCPADSGSADNRNLAYKIRRIGGE